VISRKMAALSETPLRRQEKFFRFSLLPQFLRAIVN